HTLKHNKDELSLVQLESHFRIKESLREEESGKGKGKEISSSSSVNMIEDGLSEGFWGEAMLTACYLLDRAPNKRNKVTPWELWYKKRPNLYAEHSKAYRFYVIKPNKYISVNSDIDSRDAMFDEKRFTSIHTPKSLMPSSNEDQIGETPSETPTTLEGSRDEIGPQYSHCYSIEKDPRTSVEAMQSRDVAFWKKAINDEMDSIMENNTWILCDLPPGCK
ncbi:zinc finger, CCHC-type containing protein, partial [Tanacetum coccineum]